VALDNDIEACFERGWSDGLPVVPPYGSRVESMLAALGWSATETLVELDDYGLEVRAIQVAAIAVMAGCRDEYAPVLRPLTRLLLAPSFNINGVAVTTGGCAVLVIVSGPIVQELGFASGANTLGGSARINLTVGRFANMVRHFCGRAGGILEEFGVLGHPGRISFCVAEHEQTRWTRYHDQFGLDPEQSAITITAAEGPNSVNNHYASSAEILLETIAGTIAHYGSTNFYWQTGGYTVVLAPEHASLICEAFDRDDARRFVFEHSKRPGPELVRLGRVPADPDPRMSVDPEAPRSPLRSYEQLTFLESGGAAGKFSAVIPGWVGNITHAVELRPDAEVFIMDRTR
jgi:hypothetical protein